MNQLKAGALLSYLVLALNTLVGLLYTPYLLRMLGQSEYGLYSLVGSVIAYLTILDLGFGNAIVRYTAKFRAENKTDEQYSMFGMFILLYSVIGLMALGAGLLLSFNVKGLFGDSMSIEELQKARVMMLLLTFNLAISFPFGLFGSIITAYENFVFQKVIQVIQIILTTICMVVLLSMGYKAISLIAVSTIFNVFSITINFLFCKYKLKIKVIFGIFNWILFKEISVYSFYILLNSIMDRIYWNTGQFILGIISGPIAVAVFSVAITIQQMYMSFSTAISGVFLPKITSMVSNNQSNKNISDLFIRTGRIQYIVMSYILCIFILFGKPFLIWWAGTEYTESYYVALLFIIPLTIPLIQNVGISILQARNEMKFRSILYVVIAFLSLGLSIPLAKEYGVIGCAIGTSIALCIGQILIMNIYYKKKQAIDIPFFWKEISKMSIVPIIIGSITYIILRQIDTNKITTLCLLGTIFAIIYIILSWFISMNQYERDLAKSLLQRNKKIKG